MSPTTRAAEAFERLVGIVRYLRGPDGCPWDRAQTLQSLRPFVLEETYEVLEALDREDRAALQEEIGDFIFEGVLLAQVCDEAGDFSIADSLESISDKLVRRHVHVFGPDAKKTAAAAAGGADTLTPDGVVQLWEDVKSKEAGAEGKPKKRLGSVGRTLPALLRAHEIGTRAAAVGFDWERSADVVTKIEEEVAELRESLEAGGMADRRHAEEEMGDLLFAIANLSRKLGIEPESALRAANDKFTRRFDAMEARLCGGGRPLKSFTLDEMEAAWGAVKKAEGRSSPPASGSSSGQ